MKLRYITTVAILVVIISLLGLGMVVREQKHVEELAYLLEEKEKNHLENLNEFIQNYNELYASYNELYLKYQKLASEKGFYEGWELYTITGYTSLDEGCDSYSSTGINIEKWSRYFNFCAVDPDLIPYGSVVLVKFQTGIEAFLALDCGGAIKGRRIDLYFVNNKANAFLFGRKELEVKVLR